jgi:hypothetical protein
MGQITTVIVKPVVQRSDDLISLRQIVDVKKQKLKPKFSDATPFQVLLTKEV